jgi:hypothetical protein
MTLEKKQLVMENGGGKTMKTKLINPRFDKTLTALCAAVVRRQKIWHQSGRFLRDTFLPVASPV